jgi:hypothetical protein
MSTRRTPHIIGTRIFALAAVTALGLAACGGEDLSERAAEEIVEQQLEQDGQDVDIDLNDDGDGAIRVEGSDGDVEVQFDEDGGIDLPDNFPDDVPLPEGLNIQSASSLDAPEGATFILTGTVDGDFADATDAYASALESAGFTQQSMTESTDGTFFAFVSAAWNISGGIYPDTTGEGGTVASINVVPAT